MNIFIVLHKRQDYLLEYIYNSTWKTGLSTKTRIHLRSTKQDYLPKYISWSTRQDYLAVYISRYTKQDYLEELFLDLHERHEYLPEYQYISRSTRQDYPPEYILDLLNKIIYQNIILNLKNNIIYKTGLSSSIYFLIYKTG